jgi:hypothetical protein
MLSATLFHLVQTPQCHADDVGMGRDHVFYV